VMCDVCDDALMHEKSSWLMDDDDDAGFACFVCVHTEK
jgi:hypothetical protein